jgi:hypothetical protein
MNPTASFEYKGAADIIKDPADFDAIEVHGVRDACVDPPGTHFEVDDENPESYSVYLHRNAGGVECVGDFGNRRAAMDYARELHREHRWRITHRV